jgi:hypothetical protein
MEDKKYKLLCNLDTLLQVINETKRKGGFTIVKEYEEYYFKLLNDDKVKEVIKGTIHETNKNENN